MLNAIIRWVLFALALMLTAWLIPGIEVSSFWIAMIACVVIALVNAFLKPFLMLVSLPINLLTLGIFSLVINALLFMLAAWIMPGLEVDGFLSALLGSILFSFLGMFISKI